MKKVFFLMVALFVLAVTEINAQVIVEDKTVSKNIVSVEDIKFGAKAGLNFSTFINKDYLDITPKIGAYVGGLVEIPFSEQIYAQPEMIISFQGADIGPGNLNLVYLHIPLMGKYHITDEIAAEFGPQLGFILSDNAGNYRNGAEKLETNAFQIALNAGGGYRLDDNFYFQARFSFGLSNTVADSSIKSCVLQIGAVYFF